MQEMIDFFTEYEAVILKEQKNEKDKTLEPEYQKRYIKMKYNFGATFFNNQYYDEAEKIFYDLLDYCCEKNIKNKTYYDTYSVLLRSLASSSKNETLQTETKKFYDEAKKQNDPYGMVMAYFSMANLYKTNGRREEAEKLLRECITMASNDLPYEDGGKLILESYRQLLLLIANDDDGCYKELQKCEQEIQRYEDYEAKQGKIVQKVERLFLYINYGRYYANIGDYNNAERYLHLAEEVAALVGQSDILNLHILRTDILCGLGKYEEALVPVEKMCKIFSEVMNRPLDFCTALTQKAELLAMLGRPEESIMLYDSVFMMYVNMRDEELNAQLDEVRIQYEVDKHIAEKKQVKIYMFFALGGCLLLIIIVLLILSHNKKTKEKNKKLTAQITSLSNKKIELNELRKKYAYTEDIQTEPSLFDKLEETMEKDKLFLNPEVNRDEIARTLYSNRQYLCDAIKEKTGLTFTEYIGKLRMEYVQYLLVSPKEHKTPIANLAYDSGFNSVRTFNRLFKETYGLTPGEFRSSSRTMSYYN